MKNTCFMRFRGKCRQIQAKPGKSGKKGVWDRIWASGTRFGYMGPVSRVRVWDPDLGSRKGVLDPGKKGPGSGGSRAFSLWRALGANGPGPGKAHPIDHFIVKSAFQMPGHVWDLKRGP